MKMGRKESIAISRQVPEYLLRLTIIVYESQSIKSKSDERVLRNLRFVKYRYEGMSVAEAADAVGVTRKTGYLIQEAWNEGGVSGLIPKFPEGPRPRLSESDMREIEEYLADHPMDVSGLKEYISTRYGVQFTEKHIRNLFMGHGLKYARELRRPDGGLLPPCPPSPWRVCRLC